MSDLATQGFTEPDVPSLKVIRSCVHCGFCTATCPTYVLLGDELDSPRGRIYLIKEMLENDRPATREVVKHIDRCLSCLSCMTTCPSGVHYMHLVDHARSHIEKTSKRPWHDRMIRALKKGDEVVKVGGVIGEVLHIRETVSDGAAKPTMEDRVTIKSGESRLLIERGRIAKVLRSAGTAPPTGS
jgi:Fe-S oxidoreductase